MIISLTRPGAWCRLLKLRREGVCMKRALRRVLAWQGCAV